MDFKNIQTMSLEELNTLSDKIAFYLASQTPYDVETVMQNINVLEMTVALHHLFDMKKNRIVFDQEEQSLVHQILLGQELSYSGPSEAGWALGEALSQSLVYDEGKTFVIINDHALNKGATYESLVEISKENPNLIIIMMDEQHSLLRHYGSVNAWIKSVRISKTYTSLKNDMKQVLDNKISKPLLDSLTWVRDQVKETVLEPSIFTQFGISYHGPIDGQNMLECIKVLKLSNKFIGPYVVHVQTRIRNKEERKLDFPNYKLDQGVPISYHSYLEHLDHYFINEHKEKDIFILSDGMSVSEHLIHYSQFRPRQYFSVNASTSALVDMAYGFAKEGNKVVLLVSSFRLSQVIERLKHHFDEQEHHVLLVVYEAGLARYDRLLHSAVHDMISYLHFNNTKVFMPSTVGSMKNILKNHFDTPGFSVMRLPHVLVEDEEIQVHNSLWKEILPITERTQGLIISMGPSIEMFRKKIEINNLDIALVDAQTINKLDYNILEQIREQSLDTVIYNIEGDFDLLSSMIYKDNLSNPMKFKLTVMGLKGLDLKHSSKEIKTRNHLQIDDAIKVLEGN